MLVAVIDVVLLTAIATLAAFLYNMAAALLGGIEVTLAEDEKWSLSGLPPLLVLWPLRGGVMFPSGRRRRAGVSAPGL